MFQLIDGREYLYQWDVNRKITVEDPAIDEVHFCNRTSDCSLVVEVKDGVADIPNILLQQDFPIKVYAYLKDGYTKVEECLKIKSRTKPSDYIYTETEVITVQTIEKRMDELEASFEENIEQTVHEYLEENPLNVDLEGYATEDYVDTAIYNSKDTYYLDFRDATYEEQPATPEMIEFATRYIAGQNVCAHARIDSSLLTAVHGYQPVTVYKSVGNRLILTTNGLQPLNVSANNPCPYFTYNIREDSTDGWVYCIQDRYTFALSTTEYVDNAIYNSKDAYYLDFSSATSEEQPATAEMIEFATRFDDNQNVCAHIKGREMFGLLGWNVATINGNSTKGLSFIQSGIDPRAITEGEAHYYCRYVVKKKAENDWVYYLGTNYKVAFATQEYVDNAIANLDIPESDLTIALTDDGEGNVSIQAISKRAEGGSY